MKKFLIAEGETDVALLRKLIPDEYSQGVKFVAGGGYSAAASLASSLLYDKHDSYVLLVLDADTADASFIQERYDFLDWQLGRMSIDHAYEIFLFVPTIEALFINQGIIEAKQKVSFDPKNILQEALKEKEVSLAEFIDTLSQNDIEELRRDQTIQAIVKALQQETVQS